MPFPGRMRLAAASVFFVLTTATHAQIDITRHQQDWEQCTGAEGKEAMEACTVILDSRIDPPEQQAAAFLRRGIAYATQGDDTKAIEDFTAAIQRRPKDPEAFFRRAQAYTRQGNLRRALEDLDRSLALNPASGEVRMARKRLCHHSRLTSACKRNPPAS